MNLRRLSTILLAFGFTLCLASTTFAQTSRQASSNASQSQTAGEPLSKKRLVKLVLLKDSTQEELIQIVVKKGVDFQATPSDERELHEAGASDDLIVAVRANYRGGATQDSTPASQPANATADPKAQGAQPQPNNTNGSAQGPKKKGFLSKFNEKLNKINSALAQSAGTTPQTVAPTEPANIAARDTQTTVAQAEPPGTNPTAPAQSVQKRGFLDKLNDGLNKANATLTKVAATLNPGATQTTTQPAPPNEPTDAGPGDPTNVTTDPTTVPVSQTAAVDATASPGPSDLAGTSWDLMSMTKKGETEHVNGTTPNVQFCRDGSWRIQHYGSAAQGGKYQMQGGRLVMNYDDGSLYGDYQIQRNGDEMILDDGTWVLRLKYYRPVKC